LKKKPQYSLSEGAPLVRTQVLLYSEQYRWLLRWKKRTGRSMIDLIRRGIDRELAEEEARRRK
jgi:hypothetical protein